jgi:plastocyanin
VIRTVRAALITCVAIATLAACGGNSSVGNKSLLNVKDQIAKCRIGECTTTTAAPTATTAAGGAGGGLAIGTPTTARAVTTTVVQEQVITINSDTAGNGTQFDPNTVTVYTNYPIRFTNKDSVPRSVVFGGNDTRRSPSIAPGGSWSTTFTAPGTYNYQDGTRPYAVGSIQVIAR